MLVRCPTPLKIYFAFLLTTIITTVTVSPTTKASTQHTTPISSCIQAPPLPSSQKNKIIKVRTSDELHAAVANLREGTTLMLSPGTYKMRSTIGITADNVTIRGELDNCDSVHLVGPGMRNPKQKKAHNGFWVAAKNTQIANLTVSEYYLHTITIDGNAQAPHIYNVRLVNSGQQFIKVNPRDFGIGSDNGVVEYSIMEYTNGPPLVDRNNSGTGYTNGVDIHAGSNWRISNNRFSNFHTPDGVDHLWNAAVLAWNGAENTITENNVFIDVDRSIAYGLKDKNYDHRGGIIRNNMVVMTPGLYSKSRREIADASIIIWDSPGTKVLHNTILTSGNTPNSIEVRFETGNIEISNNIADAPVGHRENKFFIARNNIVNAETTWFMDPPSGNLKLRDGVTTPVDKVRRHRLAEFDVDGHRRPFGRKVDIGADEATGLLSQ